jgi:RNA polymerase sigma-70 factor (ECF subfamily)
MSEWTPDIARLQALDDAEWLAVERSYCGRLMAYAARRIADAQAREDILQETFLGAVRGIRDFDPVYTFEQYLFGICKNRTIDHLRRKRMATLQSAPDEDETFGVEELATDDETPSAIVRGRDLACAGREMLQSMLRDWVQETWLAGEFTRLMVVEALFAGRWRNRDTWERFHLRDETAVAGIKFRALKRLRELADERDPKRQILPLLAGAIEDDDGRLSIDVAAAWCAGRVSCPARHWLARSAAGTLPQGSREFIAFHLDEMKCEWCQANRDDLERTEQSADVDAIVERVGASTLQYLRSRTRR